MMSRNKSFCTITLLSLLVLFVFGINGDIVFARDENADFSEETIRTIISMQDEYSDWEGCTLVDAGELQCDDEFGHVILYNVMNNLGEMKGYVIYSVTNDLIMEYSKNEDPYTVAESTHNISGVFNRVYSYGNYAVMTENSCIILDGAGYIIDSINTNGSSGMTGLINGGENEINTLVGGTISPQLQGNYNCIACAISNLIWYYGHNGYSSLIQYHNTFSSVINTVTVIMNSLGGFTNANIPATLSSYMGALLYSATNDWSPSTSKMVTEINANRPFLLGFAAGSLVFSYSTTEGHMTMCVGYAQLGLMYYPVVVDGHSTETVTRMWSDYNDFMCKIHMN